MTQADHAAWRSYSGNRIRSRIHLGVGDPTSNVCHAIHGGACSAYRSHTNAQSLQNRHRLRRCGKYFRFGQSRST